MKILFTYENPLPNAQADAEVFVSTARHLAAFAARAWLHVPASGEANAGVAAALAGMEVVRARVPLRPAALRHFCCGLTLPLRREFREADLVYTRNLWIAWLALLFGQRVMFDHYRPWPDQVPPLRPWIRHIFCHRRFLGAICHSEYTRRKYLELEIPAEKLHCVHNGFDPQRLGPHLPAEVAKQQIGVESGVKTVVYTGRINHKKGLELALQAARQLPDHLFILVGASGSSTIETAAQGIGNVRIVPWQQPDMLARYIYAADVLLIPPSVKPLAEFGSTVIPLKIYLYMGSGRPILAGDTPDVREILEDGRNALLVRPDCVQALVAGIVALTGDESRARRLGAASLEASRQFTWSARAGRIAAILANRLETGPTQCAAWGGAQSRAWMRQSLRWAIHLIRTRSWVLPPGAPLSPATHPEGD
ncbi:MAG TPA: glycosyltransferase [Steroidobacteraceae bacterium]|nr:glycosyltransferase [Steroidobacteraceae bacterium]